MVLETIKPAVEKESKLARLLGLIKESKFEEARNYADELQEQGIPQPNINHSCHDYFKRLLIHSPEEAQKLANVFENYHWRGWLNQKPIKTKKRKKEYV